MFHFLRKLVHSEQREGSRFESLITLHVFEPAYARCKNSNKFDSCSLTRSFVSLLCSLF